MAPKYMLIIHIGDIIAESNNKRDLIKLCNRQKIPASVVMGNGDIIHENKFQRDVNNGRRRNDHD